MRWHQFYIFLSSSNSCYIILYNVSRFHLQQVHLKNTCRNINTVHTYIKMHTDINAKIVGQLDFENNIHTKRK